MGMHTGKTCVKVITCCCVKVGLRYFTLHFILELVEHRAGLSQNAHLNINKEVKIFLCLSRIFVHKLLKSFAFDII